MLNELEESLKNVIWDSKLLSPVALIIAENCVPFYLARDSNLRELEQKLLALEALTPLQLDAILNNVKAKVELEARKNALYNSSLTNPFIYNYSVLSSENRMVLERFCDLLARDEAGITDFVTNVSQRTSLKELIDLVDSEGNLYRILKKNVLNISSNINLPSLSQESLIVAAVKKYLLVAYNDPKYSAPEVAASIRRAYRLSKLNIVDLSFFYDNDLQDIPLEKPLFMDHLELKKTSIDLKCVTVVSSYDSPLRQELEKIDKEVVSDTNLYFSDHRRWTNALMTCYTFCYSKDRLPEAQYR